MAPRRSKKKKRDRETEARPMPVIDLSPDVMPLVITDEPKGETKSQPEVAVAAAQPEAKKAATPYDLPGAPPASETLHVYDTGECWVFKLKTHRKISIPKA